MKLTFIKHVYGDKMVIVPRAELTEQEGKDGKGNIAVSLSRTGGNKCVFSLLTLAEHDDHAPPWYASGKAPEGSTNPAATADEYMTRIVADIMKGVQPVEVVTEEVVHDVVAEFAAKMAELAGGPGQAKPETPDQWKHHGVEDDPDKKGKGEVH